MIVCSCRSVSDQALRDALAAGATAEQILRDTHAGSDCGRCQSHVEDILATGAVARDCCSGPPCSGCPRRGAA